MSYGKPFCTIPSTNDYFLHGEIILYHVLLGNLIND